MPLGTRKNRGRCCSRHNCIMIAIICLHLGSVFLCVDFILKCSLPKGMTEMTTNSSRSAISQHNISNGEKASLYSIIPAKVPEWSCIGLIGSHAYPRTNHCDQRMEYSDWPGLGHVPSCWDQGDISPTHSMFPEPGEEGTFVL